MLCAACANGENGSLARIEDGPDDAPHDGWRIEGCDAFYEGASEYCAHCNVEIESAYGDPDAKEEQSQMIVHRSSVGTYHPTPATGRLHAAAQCSSCGWHEESVAGSDDEILSDAARHASEHKRSGCKNDRATFAPFKNDVITVTWRDRVKSDGEAWSVNDTRGYLDAGPTCDECGACECCQCDCQAGCHDGETVPACQCDCYEHTNVDDVECIGLSFAFVGLDGGDSLCEKCFAKAGGEVIACDCKEGE